MFLLLPTRSGRVLAFPQDTNHQVICGMLSVLWKGLEKVWTDRVGCKSQTPNCTAAEEK